MKKRDKTSSRSSEQPRHIHLLSHTHWDFEWYEIEEGFKLQLVRFIDNLLDTLEKDPEFRFHFDGQVMPIMDYLEVKEERDELDGRNLAGAAAEKIRKFVHRGQLFIGPCWTTMETSVISTESLIRNINRGRRFSKKLGGVSPIFYNADAFQYHSQVPQIIDQTALTSAFTWRAFKENAPLKDVTLWEGADKTRILKYHPARTYAQVWRLPAEAEDAAEIILSEARQSGEFAVGDHVLITQGNDQFEAQPDLNRIIDRVRSIIGENYSIDQITLGDFFKIIQDEKLDVIRGELTGNKWACTMSGQLSARIYLKQKNEIAETFVEKWAEPFAAFYWLAGGQYQAGLIERAWEYLMKQHFHHLNACAVDAVHREGEVRYNNAIELARDIAAESLAGIAAQIDTSKLIHRWENALVVFNPTGAVLNDIVTVEIHHKALQADADWQSPKQLEENGPGPREDLMIWDAGENPIPFQILTEKEGVLQVALEAPGIPPFGFQTFGLNSAGKAEENRSAAIADENEFLLENEWIRVKVHENGSFTLTDRRNSAVYKNLNVLEDEADHGDTYNFDPLGHDRPMTTKGLRGKRSVSVNGALTATIDVKLEMPLPEGLTADRRARSRKTAKLPVFIQVTVTRNAPTAFIRTTVDNRIRDHRLRALFHGVKNDTVYVQTQADVVTRRAVQPRAYAPNKKREIAHHTSVGELPMETGPSPTGFQRNFVGTNDGNKGLVLFNKGLPEYEAFPDGALALTLLRCVGWISQDDLGTRKNLAGPKIPVPEAQCPGRHIFEYAVMPQNHSWDTAGAYAQKNRYLAGVKAVEIPQQAGRLPADMSFLRLTPEALVVSGIKKAYKDGHMIVRFYNPTGKKLKGRLDIAAGIQKAWLANMNEKKIAPIPLSKEGDLALEVGPKKIMTIAVLPNTF